MNPHSEDMQGPREHPYLTVRQRSQYSSLEVPRGLEGLAQATGQRSYHNSILEITWVSGALCQKPDEEQTYFLLSQYHGLFIS